MDINRRQFLIKTSSSLAAGWALANGLRPDSAAAEEVHSIPWANPVFNMTYPTWYPDGATLAVYNNRTHHPNALPIPRTSKMDLSGTVLQQVLANNTIWAGFPSVNRTNSNVIAFAGQVVIPKGTYNQDKNYIWLTDTSTTP